MNISPELWQQIDPLLTDALALDDDARQTWLRRLEQTHPALTPVVSKILAAHDRAERSQELETVPRLAKVPRSPSVFSADARVGAFALSRLLGRGGMGEVWLAKQVDGRIEREVALKLPTVYLHSDVWRERFSRERDILAKLTHPNIARLFDAGVSEEDGTRGQPYLAMEFVEGESLSDYVATRKSNIAERLALFRQVLAAVAHAHRHLVVHRDLKPANILVDKSGQVKLLDFGIAKLLDDGTAASDAADLTRLGGRVMTLRFAAPEQVSGGAISTATDTYALGVILHELLTGLSPYRAVRDGRPLTETLLLGEDIALPSSLAVTHKAAIDRGCTSARVLARVIAGDLDAIILKALRRNPADRYPSVERIDEDIESHLNRRPVKAREGTWRYLAGRFASRHKLPITAAAAILMTMAVGLVVVERERRVAVAERARAERHSGSVRKLANSLIFDVHDQINNLSGATEAKRTLIESASKYLAQLTPDAGSDPAFRRELANAYLRLGNVQGQYGAQNIGKPEDALRNYDQAIALLLPDTVFGSPTYDAASAEPLVWVYRQKSQVLVTLDRIAEAIEAARAGLHVAESLASLPGASARQRLLHAKMVVESTHRQSLSGDKTIRMRGLEQALAMTNKVLASLPADSPGGIRDEALEDIAWMSSAMGHVLRLDPDPAVKRRALEKFREALAIREAALVKHPGSVTMRRSIVAHHAFIGTTLSSLGENREALEYITKGAVAMQALLTDDPGNMQFLQDALATQLMLARVQLEAGFHRDVLATAARAAEQHTKLPAVVRGTSGASSDLAGLLLMQSEAMIVLAQSDKNGASRATRLRDAQRTLQAAQRLFEFIDAKPERARNTTEDKAKLQQLQARITAAMQSTTPR